MNSHGQTDFVSRMGSRALPPSAIAGNVLVDADAAVQLVSEAGEAVRQLERASKDAVTRATNTALAIKTKLEEATARAERGEAALEKAQSEIHELSGLVEQAGEEILKLRSELAETEQRLAATTARAEAAERQAQEAGDAIQRIVTAIRTEIPLAPASVASV